MISVSKGIFVFRCHVTDDSRHIVDIESKEWGEFYDLSQEDQDDLCIWALEIAQEKYEENLDLILN